jgi:hypothetical protein
MPHWQFITSVVLSGALSSVVAIRWLPTDDKEDTAAHPKAVLSSGGGQSGAWHQKAVSPEKRRKTISDEEKLELAREAIRNIEFPAKADEAANKLRDEFGFVFSFPPSWKRTSMAVTLSEIYSQAAFENSSSNEEILERMRGFGAILRSSVGTSAPEEDIERLLTSATARTARIINLMPGQEAALLREYLEREGTADDEQMGARIIASGHVERLSSAETPDVSLIDGIGDDAIRMLTERTFLRTFDFGRYLDSRNDLDSDHEIAVRLFGMGLQKHPEAVSEVILNAPSGRKRDEAVEMMIYRIAKSDPERADLWWDFIQSSDIRERAMASLTEMRKAPEPTMVTADSSTDLLR